MILWRFFYIFVITNGLVCLASQQPNPSTVNTILLDVDNTLYKEQEHQIEAQIAKNLFKFCKERYNLTRQECDHLHEQYGSTVEGLRQTIKTRDIASQMGDFYEQVYQNVDVSRLLKESKVDNSYNTGYTHSQQLRELLMSLPSVAIASNSPLPHVRKILHALGLVQVPFKFIQTPCAPYYYTKHDSKRFFGTHLPGETILLVDDSVRAIEAFEKVSQKHRGIRVNQTFTTWDAILLALDWQNPAYKFSLVEYLRSKNAVDRTSMNTAVWDRLVAELKELAVSDTLVIVDVGAGRLSMLHRILEDEDSLAGRLQPKYIEYYAYEPNKDLQDECIKVLESQMGFRLNDTVLWQPNGPDKAHDPEYIFFRPGTPNVKVTLRFWDYQRHEHRSQPTPHLIVGCCFADLVDPYQLAKSILRRFLSKPTDAGYSLVYFPVTFNGITQFLPPKPTCNRIPSDTIAFALYSRALALHHRHNLDTNLLVQTMANYGATLLARGASDWNIDPKNHSFLWETMMYFFASVAAPELLKEGWDAKGWLKRAREERPSIRACNQDLLFRMSHLGHYEAVKPIEEPLSSKAVQELWFIGPKKVTVREDGPPPLAPTQIRISSECSLISSGTELTIFNGNFEDAALDVNIGGMADERMAYPLKYGYSLVGKVIECGEKVADRDSLIGRLVFSFSPHASQVIAERSQIHLVPDGISAEDAIFMPSMETALSIAHDAHIRLGERVAVFGQGLIGLLVTAVLSLQYPRVFASGGRFDSIVTFDNIPERLAMSARLGSFQALMPSEAHYAAPFDVAIEVSGSWKALQLALDTTRDGGRVVIASWYGNDVVELKLGLDFHRSHKTVITSQVSVLPAELTATWTKARRFALAWELVRLCRPSTLLTKRCTVSDAHEAYRSLDEGKDIAVAFVY